MVITNTETNEFMFVLQPTIDTLNYLAARGLVTKGEENKGGYFYCTLDQIAKAVGKSITSVQKHVEKLRQVGVLETRRTGGSKSIYKINPFKVTEF